MRREIEEIPSAVDRLLTAGGAANAAAAAMLRERDPAVIVTVARGSSDHAATYLKYACEILVGVPVASVGPSVASIYGARMRLDRAVCVAISQSGGSPDIAAMAVAARAGGAPTIAITNAPGSALAQACDRVLELHAGAERSVAATKTFVTSAVRGLWLLAEWTGDAALLAALRALPEALERAVAADWSAVGDARGPHFVLGRGPTLGVAAEAALKVKEVLGVHAEAFSAAEVLHGPVAIVGAGFGVLALAAADAAEGAVAAVADELAGLGAAARATTGLARRAAVLPAVRTGHPLTDPLALIVSFYAMVEAAARARGIDPDAPRHLSKVTRTL